MTDGKGTELMRLELGGEVVSKVFSIRRKKLKRF